MKASTGQTDVNFAAEIVRVARASHAMRQSTQSEADLIKAIEEFQKAQDAERYGRKP
jgi:hypothetical protein